jgi:hypothetical protein
MQIENGRTFGCPSRTDCESGGIMDTEREQDAANRKQQVEIGGGSAVEFAAVITVLIFVVCTAAALLLTTPRMFEAGASPPTATAGRMESWTAERPFHERYPLNAVGEPVDPPTF